MYKFGLSQCWASFQRWRRTPEEIIDDYDIDALRKRLDAGLGANDKSSGRSLLFFAITGLKSNKGYGYPVNFDKMAPIICLLLSRGANPNPLGDGIHTLLSHDAYHQGLVYLAIAYGADFTSYFGTSERTLAAKQECKAGRGRIARYRNMAIQFEKEGRFDEAARQYTAAVDFAVRYHQEACNKNPPEPDFIIQAYQGLIDQLNEACRKLPVTQPVNGFH